MNDNNVIKDKAKIWNTLLSDPYATCNRVQCYLKVDLDLSQIYIANSRPTTKKILTEM